MTDFEREIIEELIQEATGYLPVIREGLAAFRSNVQQGALHVDGDLLTEAHRSAHTIKGASGMVGLSELSQISAQLEDLIEVLMHEPDTSTPALLDGIEKTVDYVEKYIVGVKAGAAEQPELTAVVLEHIRQIRAVSSEPAKPKTSTSGSPSASTTTPPPASLPAALPEPPANFGFPEAPQPDWLMNSFASTENQDDTSPSGFPSPASWLPPGFDLTFPPAAETKPPIIEPKLVVASGPLTVAEDNEAVSAELLEVFRMEAEDHLRILTTLLPEARNDRNNRDRWQTIRRSIHTLKGAAGLVGFSSVTKLTHRMEDLLDQYYEQKRTATIAEIDTLLAATDAVADTVEGRTSATSFADLHVRLDTILDVQARLPTDMYEPEPLVEAAVEEDIPAAVFQPMREWDATVRVPIARLNEIGKLVGELVIARTSLEQRVGELTRLLNEAKPSADRLKRVSGKLDADYETSALATSRTGASAYAFAGSGTGSGDEFDALEFDRYTEFHLLTRELAETTTDVQTVFGDFGALVGDLDAQLTRQARIAGDVEDKLMRLRMVPLGTIATKLQRTVRTAAAAAHKNAEFVMEGDQTGLDKTVLEAMADPLLHLLRNAVDHGLEAEEVRLALGKPAQGTIKLRAHHEGNQVVLTITDDGRGLNFDNIRTAILRRNLATPAEVDEFDAETLADFLFRPGFSTREEVSELSGRGVGLDVVKTKVESLKGTIVTTSKLGSGTTFAIRLPMTLSVIRGLLVKSSGQSYAIPLDAIEQILRPATEDLEQVGRSLMLKTKAGAVPLVTLSRVLRLPQALETSEARPPVVILQSAGKRIAIQVDQLLGGREVVIKSLGRHMQRVPVITGATLMGDGSVVLILNPVELVRSAALSLTAAAPVPTSTTASARSKTKRTALVVDDSPSVRRVLTMVLSGAGWNVVTAKDGLDAIEVLQNATVTPDIVLTDVEMPRMDGYELLASIRTQQTFAYLPVVVITSRAADKHRKRALDLGASAYVVKPFQDQNLLEILQQLIRTSQKKRDSDFGNDRENS